MHAPLVRKAVIQLCSCVYVPPTGKCTASRVRPMFLRSQLAVFVENLLPRAPACSSLHCGHSPKFLVLGNMFHIVFTVLHPLMRQ